MSYQRIAIPVRREGVAHVVDSNRSIESVLVDEFYDWQGSTHVLWRPHHEKIGSR